MSETVLAVADKLIKAGVTMKAIQDEILELETQRDGKGIPIRYDDEYIAAQLFARLMPDDPLPANPSTR